MITKILSSALTLVYPADCPSCGRERPLAAREGPCADCESLILKIRPPYCPGCGRTILEGAARCAECAPESYFFDRAYACTWYEGPMRKLLHCYKFDGQKNLSSFFAGLMREWLDSQPDFFEFEAVIAVPLHADKKRARGFNQSGRLAGELSKTLGLSDDSDGLERIRCESTPQSRLSKKERFENIKNCFKVRAAARIFSKNLLLVDDILTTGQTLSECARTLKEAGARSITALALARGL